MLGFVSLSTSSLLKTLKGRDLMSECLSFNPKQEKVSFEDFYKAVEKICKIDYYQVLKDNLEVLKEQPFSKWAKKLDQLLINSSL